MKHFLDVNGNDVKLVLGNEQPFTNKPDHVLVLTRHKSQWVLTDHQERGFEFPGGKVERDETVEDAAMREVREETGGIVKKLVYLGQYQVTDSGKTFWKTIYFSILDEVEERSHYYETDGPVYMQELPVGLKADDRFSFIMKDEVVTSAIQFAIEQGLMS
ncbi:8-oxo-dGTP diphosphatase [Alkalihalobacillus xiaoxiensis]|uniref:8-oxo-dGTP diphosphatase n=1 Tax=Shouchella xiaoxiensis TaxID=766895 RepID=A0ABS2SS98_9BACI|nr:nucleoside triphosphatase YtkD [Shouchella xiaoxiensis]MBM7838379.1 8-oxo-dGTP diphosphatase [Shouchella xiaoxiensis]